VRDFQENRVRINAELFYGWENEYGKAIDLRSETAQRSFLPQRRYGATLNLISSLSLRRRAVAGEK
jgi:hypothetical protein